MHRLIAKRSVHAAAVTPMIAIFAKTGFGSSLAAALALGVLSWLVVDRLILCLGSPSVAVLCDGALAFSFLWFIADVMNWPFGLGELLATSAATAFLGWGWHRLLDRSAHEAAAEPAKKRPPA